MQNSDLDKLLEKANYYNGLDLHYCELIFWKKINEISESDYHKHRLADCLRVCGYQKESEKIFLSIDVNNIPKKSRHLFYDCLGLLYEEMNKYDKSINAFNESIKYNGTYSWSYVFLASVYKRKENDLEAIKYLKIAMQKIDAEKDEIHYNLAKSYLRIGKYNEALKHINSCLSIDNNYKDAEKTRLDIAETLKVVKLWENNEKIDKNGL